MDLKPDQTTTVYVGGLTPLMDPQRLQCIFCRFGPINHVSIPRSSLNMYGFVCFIEPSSALASFSLDGLKDPLTSTIFMVRPYKTKRGIILPGASHPTGDNEGGGGESHSINKRKRKLDEKNQQKGDGNGQNEHGKKMAAKEEVKEEIVTASPAGKRRKEGDGMEEGEIVEGMEEEDNTFAGLVSLPKTSRWTPSSPQSATAQHSRPSSSDIAKGEAKYYLFDELSALMRRNNEHKAANACMNMLEALKRAKGKVAK